MHTQSTPVWPQVYTCNCHSSCSSSGQSCRTADVQLETLSTDNTADKLHSLRQKVKNKRNILRAVDNAANRGLCAGNKVLVSAVDFLSGTGRRELSTFRPDNGQEFMDG